MCLRNLKTHFEREQTTKKNNTGYVFPNAKSISPFLESPKLGPTSLFCSNLAKRLHCYVTAGYPERLSSSSSPPEEIHPVMTPNEMEDGSYERVDQVGANSAVIFSPDGELVGNYRKTNLYTTDMTWAKPGKFQGFSLSVSSFCVCFSLSLLFLVPLPSYYNLLRVKPPSFFCLPPFIN